MKNKHDFSLNIKQRQRIYASILKANKKKKKEKGSIVCCYDYYLTLLVKVQQE